MFPDVSHKWLVLYFEAVKMFDSLVDQMVQRLTSNLHTNVFANEQEMNPHHTT
jgi:hypothetical protein